MPITTYPTKRATIVTPPTFTVHSTHGDLTCIEDGTVIELSTDGQFYGGDLDDIKRFDVGEYASRVGSSALLVASIDILSIGYWTEDGAYEPFVEGW